MPAASTLRLGAFAAALLAAPAASAQVAFPGYLNAGCEGGRKPAIDEPVGWTSTPYGMTCINGDAYGGPQEREGARAFLNASGPSSADMTLTQRIVANSALAGRTVTFSAYASRPVGNSDRVALTLAFFNPSDVQIGATTTSATFTPVGGVWTKYTVTAVAPAGSSRLEVGMRCVSRSNDFCNAGFDDTALTLDQALPVELVAFTAAASGTGARLAWTTASETNNSGFVVEQQRGDGWAEASAFVAGRGTTRERTDYAVTVSGLTAGRHAFRLRQTDLDGTATLSAPVTVEIAPPGGLRLTVLGSRAVRVEAPGERVEVAVYDVLGRAVWAASAEVAGTDEIALPALARGAYVVRATGARVTTSETFVVR